MEPNTMETTEARYEPSIAAPGLAARAGKVRPMILLWALGVPIPLILIILALRGCM